MKWNRCLSVGSRGDGLHFFLIMVQGLWFLTRLLYLCISVLLFASYYKS